MYLVPVLLTSDEPDAATAEGRVGAEMRESAIYVAPARRLSLVAAATAEFQLRVYANNIELPPVAREA